MRYKKKGAGMPKGAGNGMYMNGGRMYSTGGAVPGGTGPRTFQKQNVPEVELSGAAGNREASMVHTFTETSLPGVYTSDRTQAGQKVFYDEHGKQFTPEALRAHAAQSSKRSGSNPLAAFPMGYTTEASSSFNSMLPEIMMTDYEKELATRGQQRAAAKREGTFDPNANYNKIPIPAGYSTFDSYVGDTSPDAFKELKPRMGYIEREVRNQQNNVEVANNAWGTNKEGQRVWAASLNHPNQPVYYAGSNTKKEVSPTQMVLNALRYGGRHGQTIMKAMESSQSSRANNIKNKIQANKQKRAEVLPKIAASRAKREEGYSKGKTKND